MPAWRAPGTPPASVALDTWLRELGDDERYVAALVSARDGSAWAATWAPTEGGRALLLWPLPARGMDRATDRDAHDRLVALLARFDPWNTVASIPEEAPPLGVDRWVWSAFCRKNKDDHAGATPARELQLGRVHQYTSRDGTVVAAARVDNEPESLLIERSGGGERAVVIDFGTVKLLSRDVTAPTPTPRPRGSSGPDREVCLVARTRDLLEERYLPLLKGAGIPAVLVQAKAEADLADGVRLPTMHRVKGLEFPRVLLAGV